MADKEKGKVWYKIMIDFDEEIKKFQPSLEVDDAEEAIYNNDVPDITDLIAKIMEDISKFDCQVKKILTFGGKDEML